MFYCAGLFSSITLRSSFVSGTNSIVWVHCLLFQLINWRKKEDENWNIYRKQSFKPNSWYNSSIYIWDFFQPHCWLIRHFYMASVNLIALFSLNHQFQSADTHTPVPVNACKRRSNKKAASSMGRFVNYIYTFLLYVCSLRFHMNCFISVKQLRLSVVVLLVYVLFPIFICFIRFLSRQHKYTQQQKARR